MHVFRALAVTVLFISATSHADDSKKAPPAAPAGDASAAEVKSFLAFFDKLVDIVVANQDDCDKAAAGMNAHIDANKDLLDKARAAVKAGKQLPKDAQDHMQASAVKLMSAFQKCGKNDNFKAAFARIDMKSFRPAPATH